MKSELLSLEMFRYIYNCVKHIFRDWDSIKVECMSVVRIFDDSFVTLLYYPESKIVHHEFHQTVQGQVYRNVLNRGLEVFRQHDAHKWLSDDRNNAALTDADTYWAKTNWFPRVVEAGWQSWAVIMPDEVLAALNLKEFVESYRPFGLQVMVFNDPQSGMDWLEKLQIERASRQPDL